MITNIPRGIQAIFEDDPKCSICQDRFIHFEAWHRWEEDVEIASTAEIVKCWNYGVKRYCKTCFLEYGGVIEHG